MRGHCPRDVFLSWGSSRKHIKAWQSREMAGEVKRRQIGAKLTAQVWPRVYFSKSYNFSYIYAPDTKAPRGLQSYNTRHRLDRSLRKFQVYRIGPPTKAHNHASLSLTHTHKLTKFCPKLHLALAHESASVSTIIFTDVQKTVSRAYRSQRHRFQ